MAARSKLPIDGVARSNGGCQSVLKVEHRRPAASQTASGQHIFDRRVLHRQLGHGGTPVPRAPTVERWPADAVLAEQIRQQEAGLGFLQDGNNLDFGESGLPHGAAKSHPESLATFCLPIGEGYELGHSLLTNARSVRIPAGVRSDRPGLATTHMWHQALRSRPGREY